MLNDNGMHCWWWNGSVSRSLHETFAFFTVRSMLQVKGFISPHLAGKVNKRRLRALSLHLRGDYLRSICGSSLIYVSHRLTLLRNEHSASRRSEYKNNTAGKTLQNKRLSTKNALSRVGIVGVSLWESLKRDLTLFKKIKLNNPKFWDSQRA